MSRASVALLLAFCSNTRADYSDYVPQLLRGLIHLFTHTDDEIIKTAWLALSAVTKVIYFKECSVKSVYLMVLLYTDSWQMFVVYAELTFMLY